MALKICRNVGQQFRIGPRIYTLAEIKGPGTIVLETRGAMIQRFTIDTRPQEITPGVKINAMLSPQDGPSHGRAHRVWINIDAPRDIRVERILDGTEDAGRDDKELDRVHDGNR